MRLRSSVTALLRRHLREPDLGKAGIALALALMTVLAAGLAGLQGQASIEAQQGKREADRIGLEAISVQSTATIQLNTALGVYRRWFEQIELGNWAHNQWIIAAGQPDRPQLAALAQTEGDIGTWLKTQSNLFGSAYMKGNDPNINAYTADTVVRNSTLAAEQRSAVNAAASAWDGKASDYITILTIVAVALFFLGLGATVARRARPLLATAGVVFGVAAAAWAALVATAPIHQVPQAAIDRFVDAQVGWYRTPDERGSSTISNAARNGYQNAIDAAGAAVDVDPTYSNAYKLRADVRTDYADHLFFAGGPSADTDTILKSAIADFRRYLADNPNDYGAWWNLGWSLYLVGDQPASVDATNQALIRSPAQFTLYLNRALAFLAGGNPKQAQADVDTAVQKAAQDSSDSSQFYLEESDFDIGRLAAIRPTEADALRAIQVRLREAQVSLRVFGGVTPAADAPQLGQVTVTPVRVRQYQGGTLAEGTPVAGGGSLLTTDAVGFRVAIADAAPLLGRTVSARIWRDGLAVSGFSVDHTVQNLPVTLDLVSPYGYAGFNLDPGAYQLDLFVDGARRFQESWTVTPAPGSPQLTGSASALIDAFKGVGFTCADPTTDGAFTTTNCTVLDTDQTTYYADVTADRQDRISYLELAATTPASSTADVNALGHTFFANVVGLIYPPAAAAPATAWIGAQATAVDDIQIAGTTLRVFGNDDHSRNLDITANWP